MTTTTQQPAPGSEKRPSPPAHVNAHVVDVDDQADTGGEYSARCSCGWVSDALWSRRRASEAGRGHQRSP
jgi:hypothetical protein